ncbi:MAG: hypothetical protein ABH816_02475 [Candidatus Levyibacteriota bacterium]
MTDYQEGAKAFQKEVSGERTNSVYAYAIGRNPEIKNTPSDNFKGIISSTLKIIDTLEEFGEETAHNLTIPRAIADEIGLIWDFSGPGTYDKPFKEDRYKDLPWSKSMDQKRLSHTAVLERAIVESIKGNSFRGSLENIVETKHRLKKAIGEVGPYILYNGIPEENSVVKDVLSREGVVIPADKVIIPNFKIDNTLDQVKSFEWPKHVEKGKAIALVSHAPHLARIIGLINYFNPFSKGTKIYLFPLPTPQEGREEYAKMEISGLLHNMFDLEKSNLMPAYEYMIGEKKLQFSKEP